MHPMTPSSRAGFTLIELLVVMAIIATLAGLGMVGIPAILRQADKTEAKDRLQTIYKYLMIYYTDEKKWPRSSGSEFPFAVWVEGKMDHTKKDAESFFDPSTDGEPPADLDELTWEDIDWTGPVIEGRKFYSPTMRNANAKVIICNKIPLVQDEEDLDFFPHAAKGIVYLTAGGSADWIDATEWSEGWPVIGPESSVEMFQNMMVYDYQ